MTKCLVRCLLLLTSARACVGDAEDEFSQLPAAPVVKVGLVIGECSPAPVDAAVEEQKACAGVTFSRSLKYGESGLNVLDVATGDTKEPARRPVLLFVAGESFVGESSTPDVAGPMQDEAICFAARHGMVGAKMAYRLAPAHPWPAGARDVAAARSSIHQNIDLFAGNPDEIVAIGYSPGACHAARLLGHPEFPERDSNVAGALLG